MYEKPTEKLPDGVLWKDANEIIPVQQVYSRKFADPQYGVGLNSFGSPFSDLFRYKLLYEKGGWWVDMDVTCLQPFEFTDAYVFRSHPLLPMIGNVMKAPKGSALMKATYEEVKASCNENTKDWLLPNKILNEHIKNMQMEQYIRTDFGVNDWWPSVEPFLAQNKQFPKGWFCIHWMNEVWKTRKVSKHQAVKATAYQELLKKYNISHEQISYFSWWKAKLINHASKCVKTGGSQ